MFELPAQRGGISKVEIVGDVGRDVLGGIMDIALDGRQSNPPAIVQ